MLNGALQLIWIDDIADLYLLSQKRHGLLRFENTCTLSHLHLRVMLATNQGIYRLRFFG